MQDLLQLAISQVDTWESLTVNELYVKLHEKSQLYVDTRKYNLVEVAKVIGSQNMSVFLESVRAADRAWMIDQAAVEFYPGEEPINQELRAVDSVYAKMLADHTYRYISLLEKVGFTTSPSLQEVERVHSTMKLTLLRLIEIDLITDKFHADLEAVSRWDGNPSTRPSKS